MPPLNAGNCPTCNPPTSNEARARQALEKAAKAADCGDYEGSREWQGIAHAYTRLIDVCPWP